MFILRFIGRILSIGFILFIAFIVTGKNSRADSIRVASEATIESRVIYKVETFAVSVQSSSLLR